MDAPSSPSLFCLEEEELKNRQNQQFQHSPGEGASAVMASSPPGAASPRRNRNRPGNPSPHAEVIALSSKTLMAKNRFSCDVCNKGFPREQNLQLHIRKHNLPWKLKKKTNYEVRKKVYVCPEIGCVHHDPSRALGDLTGIKKHFSRKHGEKKFSCERCNKKYAVHSDLKAHNKICGTKEYKCECGTTFSRRDNFITHRSFCDGLAEEVARHTINPSPYRGMDSSILANASNPGSISLGSAAASLIPGNHQQLSSLLSVGSAFQPVHPPNMHLHPFPVSKKSFPRASDSSGIHGFPSYRAHSNMFNFGLNGGADLNSPKNDLDLNNNSFSSLLMNVETSAFDILNSTPFPQFPSPALLQKAALTGANSNNVALVKNMGSSLSGAMKFNNCGGALGDGMCGSGGRGGGNTFQEMYNNLNVGGGSTRGYGGDLEYLSDQMNVPYGGMMYNAKNADGMLVGEQVNNNLLVEPQMSVQSEYRDKLTRDFLGMGNGMNSLTGSEMEDDHNGYGIGTRTNSPDSEATISAEARPFVPRRCPGF